jgi:imidazolonepropionase-like amidohydrolase
MQTLIRNCRVLDVETGVVSPEVHVLIEGDRIREIGDSDIRSDEAVNLDARGRILMPGLIDLHAHMTATSVDLTVSQRAFNSVVAVEAVAEMERTLQRGFTTVRDAAGADRGLADLSDSGAVSGPRLFVAGRAISQTAGHGDLTAVTSHVDCTRCAVHRPLGGLSRVADGVDGVRMAVRDELRGGAHQIKVMASGGVASPSDPLLGTQYSMDELRAAVEEASAWGTYVMAHAYSAPAIARAVHAGVRTVEHANLIDADTAALLRDNDVYAVPTLVAYEGLLRKGRDLGMTSVQISKLQAVLNAGVASLELLRNANVKIGFGTDLLGPLRDLQTLEFEIRAEVLPALEIIRSATTTAAEVLGQSGNLGVVKIGAAADLLLVDGDPTADVTLLGRDGQHLTVIMKGGRVVKNTLAA